MQVADFELKVSGSSYLSFISSDGIKTDIAQSSNIGYSREVVIGSP